MERDCNDSKIRIRKAQRTSKHTNAGSKEDAICTVSCSTPARIEVRVMARTLKRINTMIEGSGLEATAKPVKQIKMIANGISEPVNT